MLVLPNNRYLFVRGSNLQPLLRAPLTRVEQRGNRLVNCGAVPALNVWLESDDLLSDNHFHLLPGESRLIEGSWTKVSWWNSI